MPLVIPGFALALILFAGLREHLELMDVPKGMRGMPIALAVAGILSLAFIGFVNFYLLMMFYF